MLSTFVHSPVKVTVAVLLIGLFGCVSLLQMPMQLTPEVQIPSITIETRWPGASPQEVEQEIVLEQEEYLKSVEGIQKMSSESADCDYANKQAGINAVASSTSTSVPVPAVAGGARRLKFSVWAVQSKKEGAAAHWVFELERWHGDTLMLRNIAKRVQRSLEG